MEKGYFQSQLTEGMEQKEQTIINVPVPSEVPAKLDLSVLPDNVIKSGAIDSLIHQNDDLMARLSVNLRRISFLEEQITDLGKSNEQYRFKYSNLKDQVLVLKEKNKAVTHRRNERDENVNKIKDDLRLLEIRYAELYTNSQERQNTLLARIDGLAKRILRFISYQRRIKKAAKNIRDLNEHLELENKKMHEALIVLESKMQQSVSNLEAKNMVLKKSVSETTDYIRKQGKDAKENQEALIDKYEDQLKETRETITNSYEEKLKESHIDLSHAREEIMVLSSTGQQSAHELESKTNQFDELLKGKTDLENKLVVSDRRQEELRIRTTTEVSDMQRSLVRFRNEAKSQALENGHLKDDVSQTREKLEESLETQGHSEEQVENLQLLWRDNQNQIEKQQEKIRALQRLNQQLSINMNQYRKELKALKGRMDTAQFQTTEKVKELKTQVKTVGELQGESVSASTAPEIIEKIDRLLVEIHSGFRSGSSED